MDADTVKSYFSQQSVVDYYARATAGVGLWRSEELIFGRVFDKGSVLLDLGTGTGRIAISLFELGYTRIMGVDYSRTMIQEARRISKILGYGVPFQVGDATRLNFEDEFFEGLIFGFNGLMQIPDRNLRKKAMGEIYRVLQKGAYFVFTTHDRALSTHRKFWQKEKIRWRHGKQNPELNEFGDRCEPTPMGKLFIHIPLAEEIRKDLKSVGFRVETDVLRSHIAVEPPDVREFSDQCRFWIAQKRA